MSNLFSNKKGIILYMVLGTILVVFVLANVISIIVITQTRFTEHQFNRVRAYYSALAGITFARHMLSLGVADWTPPAATQPKIIKTICPGASGCDINNSGLAYAVTVQIYHPGHSVQYPQPGCNYITASVDYNPNQ